jgi:hypothetical protein
MNSNYRLLIDKLNRFIRKYYLNKMLRGFIYFLSLGLALFLLVSLLEHAGNFNAATRRILFYTSLSGLVVLLVWQVIIPAFKLAAIGNRLSYAQASQIIGKHFEKVNDKLINVLQLNETLTERQNDLMIASIEQKIQELKPIPFTLAINLGENKRHLKWILIPLVIILAIIFFQPNVLVESTGRLIAHDREFVPTAPYSIKLEHDELKAYKNASFKLDVGLSGELLPNLLYIEHEGQQFLMNKESSSHFTFTFQNLQESKTFFFDDGTYESRNYELKVIPEPTLIDFSIKQEYPAYLQRKNVVIANAGDLTIPEGTRLSWNFTTDAVEEFQLGFGDSISLIPNSDENQFSYSRRLYESTPYTIQLLNNQVTEPKTLKYDITVIPDLKPKIEVERQSDSLHNEITYFRGQVVDDYGFSRLLFYTRYIGENDSLGELTSTPIKIPLNVQSAEFYHVWNMANYDLKAGDKVEYYFEIWDNDGVNGSKFSRTSTMIYKAPSLEEVKEKTARSESEIKQQLEENIALSQEIRNDMEDLKAKLLQKKNLGFQEKKQLEDILKKQKQLKESVQKMNEQNQKKNNLSEQYDPQTEELREKQEQLQDLFEKVMSEEMKQMMDEIEKMMEKLQKDKLEESLEKLELSNEDLEKELDRNLELFKQLEVEKRLNEAMEKLEKIKEEQAEIRKETDESRKDIPEELKEKQQKNNEDFKGLSKDLEELAQKNQELENPNKMENTKNLEEQIKEDMKQSLDKMQQQKQQQSSESQQNAQDKMEKLQESLASMQMQMQSSQQAENLENLRAILENLITLSFDQEAVMEDLRKTDRNDPNYIKLAQQQRKLKDDAKIIQDSLYALSKRVIQLEAMVNREISSINYNMDNAIEQLGDRNTPVVTSRQQLAMTSINNLALLLDEVVQNMQMQMQSMMQGNKNCKKPGQGKPGQGNSMSNMKQLQQQLNQQMESLKKSMQQGNKPGQGQKAGGGKQSMSKELAQMAAKQAAIRKALEDMQQKASEEKGAGGGGSMRKISELMEETETDLVNKRITNETILRQQEILTRLLESEKAEREREKDTQRKSNENQNEFFRNPNSVFEYNRQKEREIELLNTMPPSFNTFYKTKVTEYFNLIENDGKRTN